MAGIVNEEGGGGTSTEGFEAKRTAPSKEVEDGRSREDGIEDAKEGFADAVGRRASEVGGDR